PPWARRPFRLPRWHAQRVLDRGSKRRDRLGGRGHDENAARGRYGILYEPVAGSIPEGEDPFDPGRIRDLHEQSATAGGENPAVSRSEAPVIVAARHRPSSPAARVQPPFVAP